MSTYPAAARRGDSPNSSPRTARIELFIIHHYAGFTPPDQAFARFMTANDRDVCPTWQVNADGSVFECMDPDRRRPWTSGAVDNRAVTVETQNVTGPPGWLCSDASHEAIAALVAFAHARWGIPLDRAHVIGHREAPGAYATACPGGINLDWIVNRAIQLTTTTTTSKEEEDIMKCTYYYYTDADGVQHNLIWYPSGIYDYWTSSDGAYNTAVAAGHPLASAVSVKVTRSHFDALIGRLQGLEA